MGYKKLLKVPMVLSVTFVYLCLAINVNLYFKNKNGVANLIRGARARIIPISEVVYPISSNTFGKNIMYTPTAAK